MVIEGQNCFRVAYILGKGVIKEDQMARNMEMETRIRCGCWKS